MYVCLLMPAARRLALLAVNKDIPNFRGGPARGGGYDAFMQKTWGSNAPLMAMFARDI